MQLDFGPTRTTSGGTNRVSAKLGAAFGNNCLFTELVRAQFRKYSGPPDPQPTCDRLEPEGKTGKLQPCHLTPPISSTAPTARPTLPTPMVLDVGKIQDTGKGEKSVADDLEAVLRKIEDWHQGSIAGYRIMFLASDGVWTGVDWTVRRSDLSR